MAIEPERGGGVGGYEDLQFLEVAVRKIVRAPFGNRIELDTMGELHLGLGFRKP